MRRQRRARLKRAAERQRRQADRLGPRAQRLVAQYLLGGRAEHPLRRPWVRRHHVAHREEAQQRIAEPLGHLVKAAAALVVAHHSEWLGRHPARRNRHRVDVGGFGCQRRREQINRHGRLRARQPAGQSRHQTAQPVELGDTRQVLEAIHELLDGSQRAVVARAQRQQPRVLPRVAPCPRRPLRRKIAGLLHDPPLGAARVGLPRGDVAANRVVAGERDACEDVVVDAHLGVVRGEHAVVAAEAGIFGVVHLARERVRVAVQPWPIARAEELDGQLDEPRVDLRRAVARVLLERRHEPPARLDHLRLELLCDPAAVDLRLTLALAPMTLLHHLALRVVVDHASLGRSMLAVEACRSLNPQLAVMVLEATQQRFRVEPRHLVDHEGVAAEHLAHLFHVGHRVVEEHKPTAHLLRRHLEPPCKPLDVPDLLPLVMVAHLDAQRVIIQVEAAQQLLRTVLRRRGRRDCDRDPRSVQRAKDETHLAVELEHVVPAALVGLPRLHLTPPPRPAGRCDGRAALEATGRPLDALAVPQRVIEVERDNQILRRARERRRQLVAAVQSQDERRQFLHRPDAVVLRRSRRHAPPVAPLGGQCEVGELGVRRAIPLGQPRARRG
mmetsp:Transcript_63502/g.189213  ORF Transcript_63502/g.189213 Transcript_63502/m.189213 type:complete len:613 (-) Transcript_63502:29-1867(-)